MSLINKSSALIRVWTVSTRAPTQTLPASLGVRRKWWRVVYVLTSAVLKLEGVRWLRLVIPCHLHSDIYGRRQLNTDHRGGSCRRGLGAVSQPSECGREAALCWAPFTGISVTHTVRWAVPPRLTGEESERSHKWPKAPWWTAPLSDSRVSAHSGIY